MLIAQLMVLAPLALHIPLWLSVTALLVIAWRWWLERGRGRFPGPWWRSALAIAVTAMLYVSVGGSFAMETMVSLLVAGFVLKLTELRREGDVYLLCFLAYFVAATQLLFFTQFLGSVYSLLCFCAITGTLLVNQMAGARSPASPSPWRTLAGLLFQALPIMLVLFLALPRLGSLWTVPLNSTAGTTGVSDSMSPGDIADLMQSDELAFRVTFAADIPPAHERYWRALVLDEFDGRRWSQSDFHDVGNGRASVWRRSDQALTELARPMSYEIMLEPTGENWLYALAVPQTDASGVDLSRGYTLFQRKPISQRKQYSVISQLFYRAQGSGLDEREKRAALQLPDTGNLQTRERARQWAEQEPGSQALINRFLRLVQSRFRYTLQPPLLGDDSVDEFLWQTRAGFCEHFASSFVFFMRAAGVPARVVVGYQGGQVNPHEGYLTVRQLDAHAWAEVWMEGVGWQRVDPTAAVAPERIDRGVEYSLDDSDAQLLANAMGRRFAAWGNLQLQWDAFNYRWHRWVMGYDNQAQQDFLRRLLGASSPWRVTLALIVAIGTVAALIVGWLFWRTREPVAPSVKIYRRLCRKLDAAGVTRWHGETPSDFAARVGQLRPEWAEDMNSVTHLFLRSYYAEDDAAFEALKHKARALLRRIG
nr:DUF3488 and transglutaminase-like domain-containing protein [Gilvimarinus xylanilyticus]